MGEPLPLWYYAHWHQGRMRPCSGEGCRMCDAGVGKQRRWVFAITMAYEHQAYFWEVSDAAGDRVRELMEKYGQLVDQIMHVTRDNGGPKGRINISHHGFDDMHRGSTTKWPDVWTALELTWTALNAPSESFAESRSAGSEY